MGDPPFELGAIQLRPTAAFAGVATGNAGAAGVVSANAAGPAIIAADD